MLTKESTARDFVADAFAHLKFIAYGKAAMPLLEKAGIAAADLDGGCIAMDAVGDVEGFVESCRELRFWERAPQVKQV